MEDVNPYDELPYKSHPIEWTAPERLALTALLHEGPRPPLDTYRVLELGCGNGANLIPLAYYRQHGSFVGVDGAQSQIEVANKKKTSGALSNVDFIHSDFSSAATRLSGEFDYIIAHGIFSWVAPAVRDALLELCARYLRPGGLLYLNYNTKPGWNVRGMVRDFLLAQTNGTVDLRQRAELAQGVSRSISASMLALEHPYTQLLADEFRFVGESDRSYIAHEYLSPWNTAYWRSEFLALVSSYGLEYVADADYCYSSGRTPEVSPAQLQKEQITGRSLEDTIDLLCYRQVHSPILTRGFGKRSPVSPQEFAKLRLASCLVPSTQDGTPNHLFQHPSGYQVEVREEIMAASLKILQPLWPAGRLIGRLFPEVHKVMDDLMLLHRNGLIELRCVEPGDFIKYHELPNETGFQDNEYITTPYHTRISF